MKVSFSTVSLRKGFTLVELLVVVVIILAISGLTFSVVSGFRTKSADFQCANNLKDLWGAGLNFANDWNGRLPANGMYDLSDTTADESKGWMVAIAPYMNEGDDSLRIPLLDKRFRCPLDINVRQYGDERTAASSASVSYVPWTDGSDNPDDPQSPINISRGYSQLGVPWLSDGDDIPVTRNVVGHNDFESYVQPALYRHGEKLNVLYVGGAVKMVDNPSFDSVFPTGITKDHMNR